MYKRRTVERTMFYGASPEIFERATALRANQTESEKKLLHEFEAENFKEFHFRPQHPISHFIADFYCHKLKLVIEIDGEIHDENFQSERDDGRTYEMEQLGIKVIRFKNEEILKNIDNVIREILLIINQLSGKSSFPP